MPDGGLRVWLGVTDGTAVEGDDFTFSSPPAVSANATEIVIAAGATSGTATLAIIDDTEDEPDETVVLSASTDIARKSVDAADVMLTIGTGGGTGTGTGTGGGGGGGGSPTPSSDASLSALAISAGSLAFDSATTSYAVAVAHGVERVTLTPTVNQADATVAVNGSAVDSGQASAAIPLSVGENPVEVVVKAEDGSTRTYTVTVTRAAVTAALPTTLALSAAPDPAEGGPEVTVTATLDHPAPADGTRVTLATAGTARRDHGRGRRLHAVGDHNHHRGGRDGGDGDDHGHRRRGRGRRRDHRPGRGQHEPVADGVAHPHHRGQRRDAGAGAADHADAACRPGRGRRRGSGDGDRDTEQPGAGGRHDG